MSDLCEICHIREARYVCRLCGRRVCEEHFDKEKDLCVICSSSLCELCGVRLAVTYCPVCGRLICYEDSVQVDNVRRVCRECYAKGLTKPSPQNKDAYLSGAVRLAKRLIRVSSTKG